MTYTYSILQTSSVFCMLTLVGFNDLTIAQDNNASALVSLVTSEPARTVLGEAIRENQTHIEVADLKTGALQIFVKKDLKTIRKGVSEQAAIDTVGLPNYMAWRIKKVLPLSVTGKIAKIDGPTVFCSLGSNVGLEVGNELVVYRGDMEIKDPDTGEVLGKQRRKIARLEAISVEDRMTKAKLIGDLEIKLEVGDQVEPTVVNNAVAIFPLVNAEDNETVGTKRIAEELTTGLVKRGVRVVERRLLDTVLGELGRQQSGGFDSTRAQQIGKQLGAYGIVVGTVSPKNRFVEAQLRFVSVESGEILIALSQILRDTEGFTDSVPGDGKWISLFNGKDLAGWTIQNTAAATWSVEQGVIVGRDTREKGSSYLLSDSDFGDFAFRFEFSLDAGTLGGIGLRAVPGELVPQPNGKRGSDHPLFKLIDRHDKEKTGMIHWVRDGLYFGPDRPAEMKPLGSWNRAEVVVKGRTISAAVNDKPVVNTTLAKGARLSDGGVPGLNRVAGRIGLQCHTGNIRFRKIEIKDLGRSNH